MADFLNSIKWVMRGEDAVIHGINRVNNSYDSHSKKLEEIKTIQSKASLQIPKPLQTTLQEKTSTEKLQRQKTEKLEKQKDDTSENQAAMKRANDDRAALKRVDDLQKAWGKVAKVRADALSLQLPKGPFAKSVEEEETDKQKKLKSPKETKQASLGEIVKSLVGIGTGAVTGGPGGALGGIADTAGTLGALKAVPYVAAAAMAAKATYNLAASEVARANKYFGSGLSGRLGIGYTGLRDYAIEASRAGIPEEMTMPYLQAYSMSGKGEWSTKKNKSNWQALNVAQRAGMAGIDTGVLGHMAGLTTAAGGKSSDVVSEEMIGMAQQSFGRGGATKFLQKMTSIMEEAMSRGALKGGEAFKKETKDYMKGYGELTAHLVKAGATPIGAETLVGTLSQAFKGTSQLETPNDILKFQTYREEGESNLATMRKMEKGAPKDVLKMYKKFMDIYGVNPETSTKEILENPKYNTFTSAIKNGMGPNGTSLSAEDTATVISSLTDVVTGKKKMSDVNKTMVGGGDTTAMGIYKGEYSQVLQNIEKNASEIKQAVVKTTLATGTGQLKDEADKGGSWQVDEKGNAKYVRTWGQAIKDTVSGGPTSRVVPKDISEKAAKNKKEFAAKQKINSAGSTNTVKKPIISSKANEKDTDKVAELMKENNEYLKKITNNTNNKGKSPLNGVDNRKKDKH